MPPDNLSRERVRCQLVYPPCLGEAEVRLETDKFAANCCIPCGREFQKKFPPQLYGLNIVPLRNPEADEERGSR